MDGQSAHLRSSREVGKLALVAECREEAEEEVQRELFSGDDGERDSMR